MSLHLDSVSIENYRCFGDCEVSFNEDLTVLIADNGKGKTAIMDAAALVLAQFVDELTSCRQSNGIEKSDVRLVREDENEVAPRVPTRLAAIGRIDRTRVGWSCERKRYEKPTRRSTKALAQVSASVSSIKAELAGDAGPARSLPVVAYYSSTRFTQSDYFGRKRRTKPCRLEGRFEGYRNFLDPLSASQHFNEWYERRVTEVRTHAPTGGTGESSPLQQLTAVRAAVNRVLEPTGWGQIDWDKRQACIVAEHPAQGRLPLAALSSGVRNMVALTADLAHRCARLNPGLREDAALQTPGVVLIDEVDLHLHPSWQQQVVGLLRNAFKAIQFILSTHSPQVLSTVNSESIGVIKSQDGEWRIEKPSLQTKGVESADILAKVMEVDPVPHVEEANWLSDYRAYLQNARHETEEARELWTRLVAHFGEHHPVLSELDILRRLQEFKRDNNLPLGEGSR